MDRLKQFLIWLLAIIAFYLFSNAIVNMYMHPENIGGHIYNMTHKESTVNENVH